MITSSQSSKRIQSVLVWFLLMSLLLLPLLLWIQFPQYRSQVWAFEGPSLPSMIKDKGIFSDLDDQVVIPVPTWLPQDQLSLKSWTISGDKKTDVVGMFYRDQLLVLFPLLENKKLEPKISQFLTQKFPFLSLNNFEKLSSHFSAKNDRDHDGIFDMLDLHIGALKTSLNGAEYQEGYERLDYPQGDVSREIGVCTDVIVRAYRNAGWDLQKLLYEDMKKHPKAYGLKGKKPNRHIDHRRVRRLIVYFKRHYHSLPIKFSPTQTGNEAWLPGDIVFMDTLSKGRPTHVGIVSGQLGSDGEPLMINNWTYGYQTSPMSLRDAAKFMYRFRMTLPK